MAPKTLAEIRNIVAETVIREVYVQHNDYPHYFLGDEALGYADYTDHFSFDPFVILGFQLERCAVAVYAENYDSERDWQRVRDSVDSIFTKASSFTEALEKAKTLDPAITVVSL